jgi:HTH-type transcriptional regulator, transcriptional repressor of NAD biosynthesis genes
MTRGLVVGCFLPPQLGHLALIRTAAELVDELTVVVCHDPDDLVPGIVRVRWLTELAAGVRVRLLEAPSPKTWAGEIERWSAALRTIHPEPVDQVFASDPRHAAIAQPFAARFVLLDPEHHAVPVRTEQVRTAPWGEWRFLPAPVRAFFARTICLHGPESTGKTTLAPLLARHFGTLYVPEYGRTYCEQFGLTLAMDDLVAIGRTHAAMTHALRGQCTKRLILDTDPLMTAVWADMLFGRRDPWFEHFDATADLYLLLDIDVPWVDDGTRYFGDDRQRERFFDLSRRELERRGLAYRVVRGPRDQRLDSALAAIADAGLG